MSSPVRSESVSESEIDTDVDLDQVLTKYLPKHNRKQLSKRKKIADSSSEQEEVPSKGLASGAGQSQQDRTPGQVARSDTLETETPSHHRHLSSKKSSSKSTKGKTSSSHKKAQRAHTEERPSTSKTPSRPRSSSKESQPARRSLSLDQNASSPIEQFGHLEKRMGKVEGQLSEILTLLKEQSQTPTKRRKIELPSFIRSAVRDAYGSGKQHGHEWITRSDSGRVISSWGLAFDTIVAEAFCAIGPKELWVSAHSEAVGHKELKFKKFDSEENIPMSDFITTFVKGLYAETEEGVIKGAVATYFSSVKQDNYRTRVGKAKKHKENMVTYQRKKRKLLFRTAAANAKQSWETEKRSKVLSALKIQYMSSESEANSDNEDTLYVVKPLTWRSEEYGEILKELDLKAKSMKSKQGKRQEAKRVRGLVPSTRERPTTMPENHGWVFSGHVSL